jgi:O-antigen ligase
MAQRVLAFVAALALAASLPAILPGATMDRLSSLFGSEHREATESADSREYLFWKSVDYTLHFPLFGIGPEQFPNYEGAESRREGKLGSWHNTHNTFTQISSECGVPALLLFLAGLISAFRLGSNVYRRARAAGQVDMANVSFYYMLSMIGFLSASLFLSHGYTFRFPAMIGFGIALYLCTQPYLTQATARPQPFAPPVR